MEAVHGDRAYQCDKCDFTTVKSEELKSHVESVHMGGIINVTSVILHLVVLIPIVLTNFESK